LTPPAPAGVRQDWSVVAASVAGTSHLAQGLPCQDAHGHMTVVGGTLVLAVADGAGSADRADEGARLAVEEVIAALAGQVNEPGSDIVPVGADRDWSQRMSAAFGTARAALEFLAEGEGIPPRRFACTLTCALVSGEELVTAQVGDGIVVARDPDGALVAATWPRRGEYANESFFLTDDDALQALEVRRWPWSPDGLALLTDGLLRLAVDLSTFTPHPAFFVPLLAFAARATDAATAGPQLAAFLSSERVSARTDDDKTLVVAVRRSSPDVAAREASEPSLPAPAAGADTVET
jgi:hypothetical protein